MWRGGGRGGLRWQGKLASEARAAIRAAVCAFSVACPAAVSGWLSAGLRALPGAAAAPPMGPPALCSPHSSKYGTAQHAGSPRGGCLLHTHPSTSLQESNESSAHPPSQHSSQWAAARPRPPPRTGLLLSWPPPVPAVQEKREEMSTSEHSVGHSVERQQRGRRCELVLYARVL